MCKHNSNDGAPHMPQTQFHAPKAALDAHALTLACRGQGGLVASSSGADPEAPAATGRRPWGVQVVSPADAHVRTGPGNRMPQSLHSGPGRAAAAFGLGKPCPAWAPITAAANRNIDKDPK
jgi:3,4-dehydroadipyl-CoA semialdehyde dehydrogenase